MNAPASMELNDLAATEALARRIAELARPGDVIALSGGLGTGKTCFARAFIRARLGNTELDVPSPTFTLVQHYDGAVPIAHFDLYRIEDPSEVHELGLDDALEAGITLIEWPECVAEALPKERLTITLAMTPESGWRRVTLAGWPSRLAAIAETAR